MPAKHRVSIAWQIIFTFIPIANIWAFYRIRKLRKYALYIIVPSATLSFALVTYIFYITFTDIMRDTQGIGPTARQQLNSYVMAKPEFMQAYLNIQIIANIVGIGLQALSIYFVIIWSRRHNAQFDQPTTQTRPPA